MDKCVCVCMCVCYMLCQANSQFVGAVDWLCYSVAVLQVGRHLEGVDVHVGGLSQRHQLPQSHSEGPLPRRPECTQTFIQQQQPGATTQWHYVHSLIWELCRCSKFFFCFCSSGGSSESQQSSVATCFVWGSEDPPFDCADLPLWPHPTPPAHSGEGTAACCWNTETYLRSAVQKVTLNKLGIPCHSMKTQHNTTTPTPQHTHTRISEHYTVLIQFQCLLPSNRPNLNSAQSG